MVARIESDHVQQCPFRSNVSSETYADYNSYNKGINEDGDNVGATGGAPKTRGESLYELSDSDFESLKKTLC